MIYREVAVPPAARDVILCAWQFVVEDTDPDTFEHVIVPDGTVSLSLLVMSDGQVMMGHAGPSPTAHVATVHRTCHYAGIRLQPGVAPRLLARPAASLVHSFGLLDDPPAECEVLAPLLSALAKDPAPETAVIEGFGELVKNWPRPDPIIAHATAELIELNGLGSISAMAESSRVGLRQFRRRFSAATGLAPKKFARIQRIRHAMMLWISGQLPWSAIAHAAGFADQSQLIRECGEVFGRPPGQVSRYIDRIEHHFLDPFVQDRTQSRW